MSKQLKKIPDAILEALEAHGAVFLRFSRHFIFQLPNGVVFPISGSPRNSKFEVTRVISQIERYAKHGPGYGRVQFGTSLANQSSTAQSNTPASPEALKILGKKRS